MPALSWGLFGVSAVLLYGRVTRPRWIWVPVLAGIGFFAAWAEGLITQVVVGFVGVVFGPILPSALRRRRWGRRWRDGDRDGGDGNGGDGDR